jgi:peroxiredoxin
VRTLSRKGRERIAAGILVLLGVPLILGFVWAISDGERQRRETPLRVLLGDRSYERLQSGEKTEEHYLGNSLRAPEFALLDQHGKPWKLSGQRGKTVVMNFWTITCKPCVEEMPSLIDLAEIVSRRSDVELVAVTTDKSYEEVAHLFPPRSQLKILFDPENSIVRGKFGTKLFPETWVIDPRGVVRLRVDGPRDWSHPIALDAVFAAQR